MEEKNFELEIAPLTEEELDAVDGGAGESRSAWRSARCVVKKLSRTSQSPQLQV